MRHSATTAYRAAQRTRHPRVQEADVFLRVNAGLRAARNADPVTRFRALADNNLLWVSVVDVLRDPANALPATLRGGIVSLGLAVQRENAASEPDFDFLIETNEHIAAGLGAG
jgi:flagellar biosynthesis activator protein FlaF